MPDATDKAAVPDEHILRVVAWAFRPLVEAIEGANGGAAYWQARYDDAARRLAAAMSERDEAREEAAQYRIIISRMGVESVDEVRLFKAYLASSPTGNKVLVPTHGRRKPQARDVVSVW